MEPEISSGEHEHSDQAEKQRSPISGGGHSRSYECNFCKRGFSNAQALGGHMNIHRKDRAKMKLEPSSHAQVGFWVSYGIPAAHLYSTSTTSFVSRHPWIHSKGHGYDILDKTSLHPSLVFHEEVERLQAAAAAAVEVDLELRLGPQPRKDT